MQGCPISDWAICNSVHGCLLCWRINAAPDVIWGHVSRLSPVMGPLRCRANSRAFNSCPTFAFNQWERKHRCCCVGNCSCPVLWRQHNSSKLDDEIKQTQFHAGVAQWLDYAALRNAAIRPAQSGTNTRPFCTASTDVGLIDKKSYWTHG